MAEYLKLPAGEFADNTPRAIKTTEQGGVHTIHVNVDQVADGGTTSVPDGADATQGAVADPAVTQDAPGTISGKLRGLVRILSSVWDAVNGRLRVDGSLVTQPVSAASLPLPSGAASEGSLSALNEKVQASPDGVKVWMESIPAPLYYVLASIARPIWMDPATGRINVNSINTVTTISGVTNLAQLGGVDPKPTLLYAAERTNWAQSVRARIN